MTGTPSVAVVVTTHNRRAWLERCVASVLAQQAVELQIVIVDDGSTDDTGEWLRTIDDPRVTAISLPDTRGASGARNQGLAATRREYVMFLDDDDWLERGALRTLSDELSSHPAAVAAVGARRVWFTAESYARRDSHPHIRRVRDVMADLLVNWSSVPGQNLFRTDLVREIGGFDTSVVQCEDRDLALRLAALGPFVLCPEIVMTYRMHPGQTRPANLRELREIVARKAIDKLPRRRRYRGIQLRRTTWLLDEAEVELSSGRVSVGVARLLLAVMNTPTIFLSPLVGPWTVRRMCGRLARRFLPRRRPASASATTGAGSRR